LIIHKLPVITDMATCVEGMPDFKVQSGYSAETSGGIMAMVEASKVNDFVAELEQEHGQKSWIIGEVIEGDRQARIAKDCEVVPVMQSFMLH